MYGADDVSGVVNFVLKRDFEGLVARFQNGISDRGDAGSRFVSVTGGKNFADDPGDIALNYEFRDDDRVNAFRRAIGGDPLRTFALVRDPGEFPDDPARPGRILTNDLRYQDSSRGGAVDPDLDEIPTAPARTRSTTATGCCRSRTASSRAATAPRRRAMAPQNRIHNVNLLTSFEV